MFSLTILLIPSLFATTALSSQLPLKLENTSDDLYYRLPNEIRRVAVIGAGATGLQITATLVDHGFEARMFERAPNPGGVWHYTEKVPVPASFPNDPIETMAYVPDIPNRLPSTRIYEDGDEGRTVDWRLREHWSPSPAWRNMMTTQPYQIMSLPDTGYPKNTPWKLHQLDVNRHVRQYASSVGLNANDGDHTNITSYWTRVERVEKIPGTARRWTVTLRKVTPLRDGKLEVAWWQEQFDAVVVGYRSDCEAAWVPPIRGLDGWASTWPNFVFHSRQYRSPQDFANKNVLILGGGLSGVGIANDLIGHATSVTLSARESASRPIIAAARGGLQSNVTLIGEVTQFHEPSALHANLRDGVLTLANGTLVSGFDTVILATGFRKSLPFLVDYHNSTIKGRDDPETIVAPIVTDGTHLRSLHWTGHYIDDPTLFVCTEGPWRDRVAYLQALGAARVWSGKARLPTIEQMWKTYPGAAHVLQELSLIGRIKSRLFVTWLNNEILEFGGPLVIPPSFDE
ncbi:FAD/NAD(P)-binding domain-containing protein [Clavulina sp. PMI_390]|nr:FAD/NAD(P)-binding domain-containing protein [Clavulina sp. PMI_390]